MTTDLKLQAIKSTGWLAASRLWVQAVSWVVTVVLVRLLTPSDYGLFAMAVAVIGFLEFFQELGLGTAIVQRHTLGPQQINAIFWLVSSISLVLAGVAFLGGSLVASFYSESRLTGLVRILAIAFFTNSLATVPHSLLTRELDFRRRSFADSAAVLAAAVTSVALAYAAYGVWALAIGQLVRACVRTGMLMAVCGWSPRAPMNFQGIRSTLAFGFNVAGSGFAGTLLTIVNTATIGRRLGGEMLGLFTVSNTLGMDSLNKISGSLVHQVSLPVFAKLQDDTKTLSLYFLKITKYIAIASLPLQIGLALVARDLISVVLTERWLPAVRMLQAFAVCGVFFAIMLPCPALLVARGRARLLFVLSSVHFVLAASLVLLGTIAGVIGAVMAWIAVFIGMRLCQLKFSLSEIEIDLRTYLVNIASAILSTLGMVFMVSAVGLVLPHTSVATSLICKIGAGAATYVAVLMISDRQIGAELWSIARMLVTPSRSLPRT